mmetsp:Transcript_5015/g.7365  ORF Transcript_5015/g.7365 Transcript_5015/m.7365 type:complete len:80 (-) Transcript_5015:1218-1457(-)
MIYLLSTVSPIENEEKSVGECVGRSRGSSQLMHLFHLVQGAAHVLIDNNVLFFSSSSAKSLNCMHDLFIKHNASATISA